MFRGVPVFLVLVLADVSLSDLSNPRLFLPNAFNDFNLPNAFLIQVKLLGVGVPQLRYLLQYYQTLTWPVLLSLVLLLASISLHLETIQVVAHL